MGAMLDALPEDIALGLHLVPEHMRDGISLYLSHGIPPGSFLTALLSNDLMGALGRADDINMSALSAWGHFLYNFTPCGSHGSPEAVKRWISEGGLSARSVAA